MTDVGDCVSFFELAGREEAMAAVNGEGCAADMVTFLDEAAWFLRELAEHGARNDLVEQRNFGSLARFMLDLALRANGKGGTLEIKRPVGRQSKTPAWRVRDFIAAREAAGVKRKAAIIDASEHFKLSQRVISRAISPSSNRL